MSGIAGVFYRDGRPVDPLLLTRMTGVMAHRGPDGAEHWVNGSVGLGHCMLQTTPESRYERQPLQDESGKLCLVLDGRIDNRAELLAALTAKGAMLRTDTDAEIVLKAYQLWGEACPQRLLGDFAFAIWDGYKQQLFCARDQFGVKPFNYYLTQDIFVFASEIKALLSLPEMPCQINEGRVADYLVPGLEGIDKTSTFYQNIFRFPSAQVMVIECEQTRQHCYWALDPAKELRYATEREYLDTFLSIFTEAVRCRLRSSGQIGAMLSGGIDSASIVAVARQQSANCLSTFSAVSEDEKYCDETRCINAIVQMGGMDSYQVQPGQLNEYIKDVRSMFCHIDDPFDATLPVPMIMYSAAQQQGQKILFDGVDAELVLSHDKGFLTYLLRAGHWRAAIQEANGLSQFYSGFYSTWELLYRYSRQAFIPDLVRRRLRLKNKPRLDQITQGTIINPEFARRIDLIKRKETQWHNEQGRFARTVRETSANYLNAPFLSAGLERYERVASAHSIEPRHPFMDVRLVEFCLALPREFKVHRGWPKVILRRTMHDLLPPEVCWGRKWQHLGPCFYQAWFTSQSKVIKEALEDNLTILKDFVNLSYLRTIYHRYQAQGQFEDGYRVWQAVTLALWLASHPVRFR